MSLAIEPPLSVVHPSRKRFTREEARRMVELGLIAGRYELIDGEIIDKMGQNPPHARTFKRLQAWLSTIFTLDLVRLQLPIEVAPEDQARSEPEPDVAVVAQDLAEYDSRHPRGDELLLVIEIADTSVTFDLSAKASLYARAGVPEYWVLDLNRRALVVHRAPEQGRYQNIRGFSADESTSPACRPDAAVPVARLLP